MSTPNWAEIRREFPMLAHWTYLDTARKSPLPKCVEVATREFFADVNENAGDEVWSPASVEAARATMARLLGAPAASIAFVKNTTEGLNIASHALELAPGDNIVITDMEHRANLWVWDHWREKGCEIRCVQNRDGRLPLEAFLEKIDEKTRVVATAWVTYRNGYRVDLAGLGEICRAHGARLVVDAVQGAGLIDTPLSELNADFISIGGHKHLLGLTGSGVLYARPELVTQAAAGITKTAAYFTPNAQTARERYDQHRFESGNPNFLGLYVLRRSAAFIESIGLANIESRVRDLTGEFLALLKKRGIRTQTPDNWRERCQIVNVLIDTDAQALAAKLHAQRIAVNVRDGILRVSMSFFNNEEDLETLLRALPH
jgi:cysteine desulfurase/selenocysteine lyase